jgi:hypothetical protein
MHPPSCFRLPNCGVVPIATSGKPDCAVRLRRGTRVPPRALFSSSAPVAQSTSTLRPPLPASITGQLSVYAVSDLHCDYPANVAFVEGLPNHKQQQTAGVRAHQQFSCCIVAGDVSDDLRIVRCATGAISMVEAGYSTAWNNNRAYSLEGLHCSADATLCNNQPAHATATQQQQQQRVCAAASYTISCASPRSPHVPQRQLSSSAAGLTVKGCREIHQAHQATSLYQCHAPMQQQSRSSKCLLCCLTLPLLVITRPCIGNTSRRPAHPCPPPMKSRPS